MIDFTTESTIAVKLTIDYAVAIVPAIAIEPAITVEPVVIIEHIIVERCKSSVELLDSRAKRVNKTEDSWFRDGYLISMKPYPKELLEWLQGRVLPLHIDYAIATKSVIAIIYAVWLYILPIDYTWF